MGACGAGLGILVWLFHLTTDENYCMQMAKNYMVDYLENVCLHKYEKANQKERTGRRDSVIKKDETNDTKEEKAEKEDKTEQEEKEESVPVSGSGVVQMQRESRRKERVKENARNLAKASVRLAGTDGSKKTEDILQEEVQSTGLWPVMRRQWRLKEMPIRSLHRKMYRKKYRKKTPYVSFQRMR